ncbi:MAG: ABC transporter substrate-binding protein, partial [Deltaproteobacteria bacterium]|nr:ABC transporter substrate-binding protein [Deltaproteobacteria bacterium]
MNTIILSILSVSVAALAGCGSNNAPNMPSDGPVQTITDSIGRRVVIPDPVTRAVIANGYNLELINALGAIDKVVGVDQITFSDRDAYGKFFSQDQVIGQNTNELNYEKIIELDPEVLIITANGAWEDAQKHLAPFGIKVVVLNAYYSGEYKENWALAGQIFGRETQARELTDYFADKLGLVQNHLQGVPRKTVYYEYKRAGNTTVPGDYFYNMVVFAGGRNIFDDAKSVEVDPETVIWRNPEYIVRVGTVNVNGRYVPPTPAEFERRREEIFSRPGWDEISAVKNDRLLLLSHYSQGAAGKLVGTMYIAKYMYPEHLPDLWPEDIFKTWLEKYQHLPYIKGHTVPAYPL